MAWGLGSTGQLGSCVLLMSACLPPLTAQGHGFMDNSATAFILIVAGGTSISVWTCVMLPTEHRAQLCPTSLHLNCTTSFDFIEQMIPEPRSPDRKGWAAFSCDWNV